MHIPLNWCVFMLEKRTGRLQWKAGGLWWSWATSSHCWNSPQGRSAGARAGAADPNLVPRGQGLWQGCHCQQVWSFCQQTAPQTWHNTCWYCGELAEGCRSPYARRMRDPPVLLSFRLKHSSMGSVQHGDVLAARAEMCGFRGCESRLQQVCRSKRISRLCRLSYRSCQWKGLGSSTLGVEARRQAAGRSAGSLAAPTQHSTPSPAPSKCSPSGGHRLCCWQQGAYPEAVGITQTLCSWLLFL